MKVRYKGPTFGGGVLGLTDGKTYECTGIEYDLLRIIDDEGEDYLYSLGIKPREDLKETFRKMPLRRSTAKRRLANGKLSKMM